MLTAAAAQVAFRVRGGQSLDAATSAVLAEIAGLGGEGGIVAVDREGRLCLPFNAEGMKRAWLSPDGDIQVAVFEA